MKRSDNQINASFMDISRIKWLVFFIAVVFLPHNSTVDKLRSFSHHLFFSESESTIITTPQRLFYVYMVLSQTLFLLYFHHAKLQILLPMLLHMCVTNKTKTGVQLRKPGVQKTPKGTFMANAMHASLL